MSARPSLPGLTSLGGHLIFGLMEDLSSGTFFSDFCSTHNIHHETVSA